MNDDFRAILSAVEKLSRRPCEVPRTKEISVAVRERGITHASTVTLLLWGVDQGFLSRPPGWTRAFVLTPKGRSALAGPPPAPPVAWNNRLGLPTANIEVEDGDVTVYFLSGYEAAGSVTLRGVDWDDVYPEHVGQLARAALALFDAGRPTRCGFGPLAALFVDTVRVEGFR